MKALPMILTSAAILMSGGSIAYSMSGSSKNADSEPDRATASSCEETGLNQECYHGGSADAEEKEFRQYSAQIREIIQRQAETHRADKSDKVVYRHGFHAKSQTCLQGELHVVNQARNGDPRIRHGIFQKPDHGWPIWVRFSNGVGWVQKDKKTDVRGVAIKVMKVPGKKLLSDEKQTQDFLMTNSPVPIGADAGDFMEFAEANSRGIVNLKSDTDLARFYLKYLPGKIFTDQPQPIDGLPKPFAAPSSMARLRYWSGSPYRLGADQAVKFQLQPRKCSWDGKKATVANEVPDEIKVDKGEADYLRAEMIQRAEKGVCFDLFVQFQVDPKSTPVENTSVEWEESVSPPQLIAQVLLPPQKYLGAEQDKFCNQLSFNPWHSIEEHRPLGHMNRARKAVYDASREFRKGGYEPTSKKVPAPK